VTILSIPVPRKEKSQWFEMPANHNARHETEGSAVQSEASYPGGVIREAGCEASHPTGAEANAGNATGAPQGEEANAAETLARAIDGLAAAAQAITSISSTFYTPPLSVVPLPVAGRSREAEAETTKRGEKRPHFAESAVAEPPRDVFANVAGLFADAIDALIHASEALVGTVPGVEPAAATGFAEGVKTVKVEAQRRVKEVAALASIAQHQIQAAAARAAEAQSQAREVAVIEAEARAAEARYRAQEAEARAVEARHHAQEVAALRAEARCQTDEVGALAAETMTSIQDVENFIKTLIANSQTENLTEDGGE
jgi:hypothetical protein